MKTQKEILVKEKEKEDILKEYLNHPNTPKELEDALIQLRKEHDQKKFDDEKSIEDNKHRKIIGYDSSFMPIYE